MKHRLIRMIENERLINATHWGVFSLGATALAASITATALNLLFS